jgi:4-amino-4-deoxy-L-arabinose transferase-like glycosyltransferase
VAFGLGTVLTLYGFGRDLYGRAAGLTAALCFICFPYFFRLSAAASNDIQVTFFFLLTLWIAFRVRRDWSWGLAAVGGLALGLGILSKYPMVLVYPVLGYLFWTSDSGAARARLAFLVSVSVAIALAWLGLAFHIGIFQLQSGTLTGFSLSVAETIWGKWMFLEFATTRLPSALGVYSLPALIVGGVLVATRPRDPNDRLLLVWPAVVFGFFSVTLPDSRYCLPAYPALALIMARGLDQVPQAKEKVLWLLLVECALALYLFVDWSRSSHLFIDEYKGLMP